MQQLDREHVMQIAAAFGGKALLRDNPPTIDALCIAAQTLLGIDDHEAARLLIALCNFDTERQATKQHNLLSTFSGSVH